MKSLAVFLPLILSAIAQAQTSGTADTKGSCSPANTGNNNIFTINCGIGKVQGEQLLRVLNAILSHQLDPDAVMMKLDDMHLDIKKIRDGQGWPVLTTEELNSITAACRPFSGQKVQLVVPNGERDTDGLARQLAGALKSANWGTSVKGEMRFYAANAEPPVGIVLSVKEDGPAVQAFAGPLLKILGESSVHGERDAKLASDLINVTILRKPR